MVEFSFDAVELLAEGFKPWTGDDTPEAVALRMWLAAPEELDFPTACALARVDGEVYNALWRWAVKAEGLSDDAKAALFDALVRKNPRKRRPEHGRGLRLWAISEALKRRFPYLRRTVEIPDTLAGLPGCAMDRQSMINLLNRNSPKSD